MADGGFSRVSDAVKKFFSKGESKMAKDYSETIKNAVENFLKGEELKYEFNDDGIFLLGMQLTSKLKSTKIHIIIEESSFLVTAISPIGADTETIPAVAEFIARVNYSLRIGGFVMDARDGEVSYRASLYLDDRAPTQKQVRVMFLTPMMMLDKYGDALTKVIYGFATPQEAIAEAEK